MEEDSARFCGETLPAIFKMSGPDAMMTLNTLRAEVATFEAHFEIISGNIFIHNPLPNDKILDWSKSKAFADNKINVNKQLKFGFGRVENIVKKRRKCWLPAFFPFPTIFSKGLFLKVFKSQDCVVKSKSAGTD